MFVCPEAVQCLVVEGNNLFSGQGMIVVGRMGIARQRDIVALSNSAPRGGIHAIISLTTHNYQMFDATRLQLRLEKRAVKGIGRFFMHNRFTFLWSNGWMNVPIGSVF